MEYFIVKNYYREIMLEGEQLASSRREGYEKLDDKYILPFPEDIFKYNMHKPYLRNDYRYVPVDSYPQSTMNNFLDFFVKNIDQAIDQLQLIYSEFGYDCNELDFSAESVEKLEAFIENNIETMEISERELQIKRELTAFEVNGNLFGNNRMSIDQKKLIINTHAMKVSSTEITLKWCNIIHLTGVYMSKTLMLQKPMTWKISNTRGKVNYNMPTLVPVESKLKKLFKKNEPVEPVDYITYLIRKYKELCEKKSTDENINNSKVVTRTIIKEEL